MSKKPQTLGSRVKEARERLGISQRELGRRIGKGSAWMSALESNTYPPSAKALFFVADVLGVSMEYLISGRKYKTSIA